MATQLLIYETAVPVSRARHGQWSVEVGADYGFSSKINSVPLMALEFGRAAIEYPIVFTGNENTVMPAVILGVRDNENLFIKNEGVWNAKYIPAFVRRYPFVLSASPDGKGFTLCIDESFAGCNRENRGQRLFDDQGTPTPYVQNTLNFLQGYQSEFQRTQAFCRTVRELGLLEPMQAQISLDSGQLFSLTGFTGINRDRLKALPSETLAELAKSEQLEWFYLQIHSLHNFERMKDRLSENMLSGAKGDR